MTKKLWFFSCGLLLAGLGLGYFYAHGRAGATAADTAALLQFTDLGETEQRAFQAYQHQNSTVAIYALSEALEKENQAERVGQTPFINERILSIDLLLTHARLAKLYDETGQTNLSAQHIADALLYARQDGQSEQITNEIALMQLVARFDQSPR